MASEVDICNLALGHLGDNATVASIDPPEGSAQAEHCARFYPIARDTLLASHAWSFASGRTILAMVTQPWTEWLYAYAVPADMMTAIAIMPPDATDDYSTQYISSGVSGVTCTGYPIWPIAHYVPRPYVIESDDVGNKVIYTNQEHAVLRYQKYVSDTTKFSPLFVMTLTWQLASMLAGPIIKGDQGAAEAKRCLQMMATFLTQAKDIDSRQHKTRVTHIVPWISGR